MYYLVTHTDIYHTAARDLSQARKRFLRMLKRRRLPWHSYIVAEKVAHNALLNAPRAA